MFEMNVFFVSGFVDYFADGEVYEYDEEHDCYCWYDEEYEAWYWLDEEAGEWLLVEDEEADEEEYDEDELKAA